MYHEMCQKLAKSITIWHFQSSNRAFLVLFANQNTHFLFKKAVLRMKIYKGRHTKIPAYGQSPPIGWAVNARRLGIHCP